MFFQVESAENFSKFCLKGYVAKMAEKKILCMPCCKALGSVNHQAESIFIKLKDRGSLFKPTQSVITICEETGKCFERMMKVSGGNLPHWSNIPEAIVTAVLPRINKSRVFTRFFFDQNCF